MNSLDLIFIMIVVLFVTIGALRGFVREASALLAWTLATLCAWFLADSVTGLFELMLKNPRVRLIAAFVTVFLVVFFVIKAVFYVMQQTLLTISVFKLSNQILGGAVAAAKSMVIILILVMLASFTALPEKRWWRTSATIPYFEQAALWLKDYIPADVARYIKYR